LFPPRPCVDWRTRGPAPYPRDVAAAELMFGVGVYLLGKPALCLPKGGCGLYFVGVRLCTVSDTEDG
jgi:hypothetical protein